jgi:hypothetical protein
MKGDPKDPVNLAPREERAILDEIRNDRELIRRLKITPQELEALSKCALLGTLTCKQDMLFILRQIREATSPTIDHTTLFPKPPESAAPEEGSGPDMRASVIRVAPIIIPEPGSLDTIVSKRRPEQIGVLFWVVILVASLVWCGVLIMTRMRDSMVTIVGSPVSQAPVSNWWYDKMDHVNVLLFWEVLFVVAIAIGMQIKSQRSSRRFKIRPGRRVR